MTGLGLLPANLRLVAIRSIKGEAQLRLRYILEFCPGAKNREGKMVVTPTGVP